jgi:hypothetical protein
MRALDVVVEVLTCVLVAMLVYACTSKALDEPTTPTTSLPPVVSFERAGGDHVG